VIGSEIRDPEWKKTQHCCVSISYVLWQVRKRGNRRDPNEAGAGHASDTDSALEDSASDTDSEAADTDQDQSDADAADGRPKKKGNNVIIVPLT
jgi:hypothetical protein